MKQIYLWSPSLQYYLDRSPQQLNSSSSLPLKSPPIFFHSVSAIFYLKTKNIFDACIAQNLVNASRSWARYAYVQNFSISVTVRTVTMAFTYSIFLSRWPNIDISRQNAKIFLASPFDFFSGTHSPRTVVCHQRSAPIFRCCHNLCHKWLNNWHAWVPCKLRISFNKTLLKRPKYMQNLLLLFRTRNKDNSEQFLRTAHEYQQNSFKRARHAFSEAVLYFVISKTSPISLIGLSSSWPRL